MAKVLSGYGYDTAAFGKWHNTPIDNLFKSGPFDQYPTGLGFSYFYGLLRSKSLYLVAHVTESSLCPRL